MVEHGVDVALVGGNQSGVGEEILRVGFLFPGEELADAAHGAGRAIPDKRDDEAHAMLFRGLDRVVGHLKCGGIELAFFGLDAKLAADGVAERLRAHDLRAHLFGGRKGVVDFEVAGVTRALRVVRAVAFEAEPLNVGSAVAEGCAGEG